MKTPIYKILFFGILLTVMIVFSWQHAYAGQEGVQYKAKNAIAPFDDEKKIDSVPSLPDNSIMVNTKYQGGAFWTLTRKDKVERFKCTQCHNPDKNNTEKTVPTAHGDIILIHGGEKPLSCFTCHKEDERDFLVTEKGTKVNLDHSYQLCTQCHFRQAKDWVGGAHGKRVSYWAGKRVVKNCTACHNPHSPRFKKRWPKTYSLPLK